MTPTTQATLAVNFAALLAGVRSIQPRCPDCSRPLDAEHEGVRTRINAAGKPEKVCRPCFQGELAEALMNDLPSAS